MKTKIIMILLVGSVKAQVGINTTKPNATLDIIKTKSSEKILRLSDISHSLNKRADGIEYTKGTPLYIDDKGYVFSHFSPVHQTGLSAPFDKRGLEITDKWLTIYKLTGSGSIADFKFFTNFSLGPTNAIASGKISVGTGSGINLYDYNSSSVPIVSISNNRSKSISINFASNPHLQFQLTTNNEIQIKLSSAPKGHARITIYDSAITRL